MHRAHPWLAVLLLVASACATPYYSDLPLTPTRAIAESEDALRRGEYATAASGFTDYLASGQQTFRARAYYQLAQAQYGLENYEGALDTLADMDAEYPNAGPQAAVLRGDIYYALGRRVDAIVAWQDAWARGTDSDRVYIRSRIEEASDELTASERTALGDALSDNAVRALVGLAPSNELGASGAEPLPAQLHGAAAAAESEADTAAGYAALAAAAPPPDDLAAGDALAAGLHVAALLPLTGPDRAHGQRALAGLRLAFDGTGHMLQVRDTANDPDLAAQLTTALASEPNMLALIGPLRHDAAAAVAPLAERLQMPTILLARSEGLAGPYVLQAGATLADQMRLLADYAVVRQGYTRLGIVYPDDGYGRSYMQAFRSAAQQAGATAVKTNAYRPGQPSFGPQAAATGAWARADGVQAVFIPDDAATAIAVARAVRGAAPGIALLGSESWNQPSTLAAAGGAVDGAVFADRFVAGDEAATAEFATRFRARYGSEPSGSEAAAYDAGMLVRQAIAGGARARGALLQALRTAIGDGGGRQLLLLQVRDGRVAALPPP